MGETEALEVFRSTGLEPALAWAAPIAFAQTAEDYDEDRGHDQFIIGGHNFVYLRDLIDRCTANGKYVLAKDAPSTGRDILARGISASDFANMPTISPGQVARSDYDNSPGWASGGLRVVLQSFRFGRVDRIKWARPAKRRVASQDFLASVPLFDDVEYGLQSITGIPDDDHFDGTTLVVAHGYNPVTGQYEVFVGQSRIPQYRGDACWHWRALVLRGGASSSGLTKPTKPSLPGTAPSGQAEEIEMKLKKPRQGATGSNNE